MFCRQVTLSYPTKKMPSPQFLGFSQCSTHLPGGASLKKAGPWPIWGLFLHCRQDDLHPAQTRERRTRSPRSALIISILRSSLLDQNGAHMAGNAAAASWKGRMHASHKWRPKNNAKDSHLK